MINQLHSSGVRIVAGEWNLGRSLQCCGVETGNEITALGGGAWE